MQQQLRQQQQSHNHAQEQHRIVESHLRQMLQQHERHHQQQLQHLQSQVTELRDSVAHFSPHEHTHAYMHGQSPVTASSPSTTSPQHQLHSTTGTAYSYSPSGITGITGITGHSPRVQQVQAHAHAHAQSRYLHQHPPLSSPSLHAPHIYSPPTGGGISVRSSVQGAFQSPATASSPSPHIRTPPPSPLEVQMQVVHQQTSTNVERKQAALRDALAVSDAARAETSEYKQQLARNTGSPLITQRELQLATTAMNMPSHVQTHHHHHPGAGRAAADASIYRSAC